MDEEQLPKNNEEAYNEFLKWKNVTETELGKEYADWKIWWICFLAGWHMCMETLGAR